MGKSAVSQGLSVLLYPSKQGRLNCCRCCVRKSGNWLLFLFLGAKATVRSAKFPHSSIKGEVVLLIHINELWWFCC